MKLALLLIVLFLIAGYKIYRDYEGDKKQFAIDIALLLFLLFATYFDKYLRIVLPLFIAHTILLLFAWGWYYFYLFKKRVKIIYIFAPIITIGAFFILGLLEAQ